MPTNNDPAPMNNTKTVQPTNLYFTLPRIIHMESMEWGMDSIIFPWNGGWTPYFFKMESMEWGMDSMNWGMDSILFLNGFHEMGDGFHGLENGLHTLGALAYLFTNDIENKSEIK